MVITVRTAKASVWLVLALSVGVTGFAQAAMFSVAASAISVSANTEITPQKTKKTSKSKTSKKDKGGKITFHDGSAESRAERDKRLKRECKGRTNAGVCEGYTGL
jgi:hypothetical protein